MAQNRYKFISILLVIFVAISLTGCSLHKKSTEQTGPKLITLDAEQEQSIKLATEVLKNQVLQLKITIPAQFQAMQKRLDRIYAPIDGKVIETYVDLGDIVKVGQPLVRIKSDMIGQIQLEFLDKYIFADSNVKQMVAQYNLSTSSYKRENTLYHEGISSRAEYEVARAQMLKDKAALDGAKAQRRAIFQVYAQRVALYGGNAGTISRALATKSIYPYITLCANKHGVVLNRFVNPGEIVNQNKELVNLADLSTIWLVGYAFEKDSSELQVGQDVVGVFEKEHGKTVKGKLSYVASILDPDKKTMEVIADIPNADFSIKPNMYAEMVVDTGTVEALAVPNTALQKYGDYNFVYVEVKPHVYEERKVEIGQHNDKYSEVKSGLKVGEKVVSNGGFSLLGESIKMAEE